MAIKYCSFSGCPSNSLRNKNVRFFVYPKLNHLEWVAASKNSKLEKLSHNYLRTFYYVCDKHFSNHDFVNILTPFKNKLKPGAVPSPATSVKLSGTNDPGFDVLKYEKEVLRRPDVAGEIQNPAEECVLPELVSHSSTEEKSSKDAKNVIEEEEIQLSVENTNLEISTKSKNLGEEEIQLSTENANLRTAIKSKNLGEEEIQMSTENADLGTAIKSKIMGEEEIQLSTKNANSGTAIKSKNLGEEKLGTSIQADNVVEESSKDKRLRISDDLDQIDLDMPLIEHAYVVEELNNVNIDSQNPEITKKRKRGTLQNKAKKKKLKARNLVFYEDDLKDVVITLTDPTIQDQTTNVGSSENILNTKKHKVRNLESLSLHKPFKSRKKKKPPKPNAYDLLKNVNGYIGTFLHACLEHKLNIGKNPKVNYGYTMKVLSVVLFLYFRKVGYNILRMLLPLPCITSVDSYIKYLLTQPHLNKTLYSLLTLKNRRSRKFKKLIVATIYELTLQQEDTKEYDKLPTDEELYYDEVNNCILLCRKQ